MSRKKVVHYEFGEDGDRQEALPGSSLLQSWKAHNTKVVTVWEDVPLIRVWHGPAGAPRREWWDETGCVLTFI